jgi:hypothetical protein
MLSGPASTRRRCQDFEEPGMYLSIVVRTSEKCLIGQITHASICRYNFLGRYFLATVGKLKKTPIMHVPLPWQNKNIIFLYRLCLAQQICM